MCSRYTLRAKSAAIVDEFDLPQKTLERCARVRQAGSAFRLKPRGLCAMGQRNRLIILGCALLLGLILPVVRYLNRSDCSPSSNPNLAGALWFEHLRIPLENRSVAIPDRRPSQDLAASTVQVLETDVG